MNPLSGGTKRSSPEAKSSAGEPSAKRPRVPPTPLETVHNDLDDATHARLDTLVLKTCKEPVESVLAAAFLLPTIVWNSEGRLDPKYSQAANARALIEENLELVDMLRDAWNDKSFKQIRNLSAITTFFLLTWDGL